MSGYSKSGCERSALSGARRLRGRPVESYKNANISGLHCLEFSNHHRALFQRGSQPRLGARRSRTPAFTAERATP